MTISEMVVESDVDRIIREQFERDVSPNWRLPVKHATWMRLHRFGVNESAPEQGILFIDDGIDVSQQMRHGLGFWVFNVEGWVPYTEWRDVQISEMAGEGRPWLHRLEWLTRMRVYREFVLLLNAWNAVVRPEHKVWWWLTERQVELPDWTKRWLALTNEAFERGIVDLERAAWDALSVDETIGPAEAGALVQGLVAQYAKSRATWRPIMPARAEYHRKYGDRDEYWTFER